MRLEPLLTLEIREKIRRAVSELNDIESELETHEDFSRPTFHYGNVELMRENIVNSMAVQIDVLNKSKKWLQHMRECVAEHHDITHEEFERLHQQ